MHLKKTILYYRNVFPVLIFIAVFGLAVSVCPAQQDNPDPGSDFSIYLPLVLKSGLNYYVDSVNGSDTNPGTSEARPWRTLAPVQAANFPPNSTVHFKRGSTWTGELTIDTPGTPDNPVTFTAYGPGDPPLFRNPGSPGNLTRAIKIYADWVIVENLMIRDTYDAGILVLAGSDHNIIRNNEFAHTGLGTQISGGRFSQLNLSGKFESDIGNLRIEFMRVSG